MREEDNRMEGIWHILAKREKKKSLKSSIYERFFYGGNCYNTSMIEKVVKKENLKDFSEVKENLVYWLSRKPDERVAALEQLRRQHNGSAARLQRSARVFQRPKH